MAKFKYEDIVKAIDYDIDDIVKIEPDVTNQGLPFTMPNQPTLQERPPDDTGMRYNVQPEGQKIENPDSEYWKLSDEDKKKYNLALKYLTPEAIARGGFTINGKKIEAPYLPYGKATGVLHNFVGGLSGKEVPDVKGSSPTLNLLSQVVGEGAKYASLYKGLGQLGVSGTGLDVGAGVVSATERQALSDKPSLEAGLAEAVTAGATGAFVRATAGAYAEQSMGKFIDDMVTIPETKNYNNLSQTKALQKITPELKTGSPFVELTPDQATTLSFFGYNPEVAKSIQKAWQGVVDKTAKKAINLIPKKIQEKMTDYFVSPAPKGAKTLLRQINKNQSIMSKVGDDMAMYIKQNVPKEYHQDVFRVLDPTAFGDLGNLPQEYRHAIGQIRDKIDELGQEAVNLGLLDEKTYARNVGEYLGRYYDKYKDLKYIKGGRFKKRILKTVESRLSKGLITDPVYAVGRTIGDLTYEIEAGKMFSKIAQNTKWVREFDDPAIAEMEGFVKLPKRRIYGHLSDKYVEQGIYDEITTMFPTRKSGKYGTFYSEMSDFWDLALSAWKYGKTAMNPATHGRNLFSNVILADLGGLSPMRVDVYSKALTEYTKKGKFYREAFNTGLLGSDWYGAEIGKYTSSFGRNTDKSMVKIIWDIASDNKVAKGIGAFGKAYQGEEHFFKLAMFIHRRNLGDTPKRAAAYAQKYLFDYNDLSPFLKKLRQSPFGGPFLSFTAKSLPVLVESAVKHPLRFWKWPLMFKTLNETSKHVIGMTDKEYDDMVKNLPEWQKSSFLTPKVLLPVRGVGGKPRVLDLTYNLPWGQIGEQGQLMKKLPYLNKMPGGAIIDPFIGSNPFTNLAYESMFNENLFTGEDIYNELIDTDTEASKKMLSHVHRQLAPGIVVNAPDVYKSLTGGKNKRGNQIDPYATVLNKVLGIKVIEIDTEFNKGSKEYEIYQKAKEILKEAKRIERDQSGEIDKEEAKRVLNEKKNKLKEEWESLQKTTSTTSSGKKSKQKKFNFDDIITVN